jgi:hypothetical protein
MQILLHAGSRHGNTNAVQVGQCKQKRQQSKDLAAGSLDLAMHVARLPIGLNSGNDDDRRRRIGCAPPPLHSSPVRANSVGTLSVNHDAQMRHPQSIAAAAARTLKHRTLIVASESGTPVAGSGESPDLQAADRGCRPILRKVEGKRKRSRWGSAHVRWRRGMNRRCGIRATHMDRAALGARPVYRHPCRAAR